MIATSTDDLADAPLCDWLARGLETVAGIDLGPSVETVGRVESVGDGIAFVSGLPDVRLNELLRFEGGRFGFALALDSRPHRRRAARRGRGDRGGLEGHEHGRGGPHAGRPRIARPSRRSARPAARRRRSRSLADAFDCVERPAPAIIDRDLVSEPIETGLLVVDAMFALGRGQRELIIGDRATGKTSIAVDVIVNQKHSDMICVYVAVGQRATAVERVIEAARARGAPERTIFVVASASAPPGLQWIAPFAGFTIAEYFRDRGGHALVIIDDLTKHAATHRELALLTREPPGREAYPGDIFYLHARLLERAAKLSAELGGGSVTALPIAETDAGNLSAYIPTNLISITDGQIVLDSEALRRQSAPGRGCGPERQPRWRQGSAGGATAGIGPVTAAIFTVPRTRNVHEVRRNVERQG